MTGFFATLTEDQKRAALAYRGDDTHGEAIAMDIQAQIHNRLYEALEAIDAPLDLLQIVGSWRDTQSAEQTLEQLEAFIEREKNDPQSE